MLHFWIRTNSLEDSIDVDFDGWGKERFSDDGCVDKVADRNYDCIEWVEWGRTRMTQYKKHHQVREKNHSYHRQVYSFIRKQTLSVLSAYTAQLRPGSTDSVMQIIWNPGKIPF